MDPMRTPPHLPTEALPGTLEKIEVLRARASRHMPLFLDGDCPLYKDWWNTDEEDSPITELARLVDLEDGWSWGE